MLYFSEKAKGIFNDKGVMVLSAFTEEAAAWDGKQITYETIFVTLTTVHHSLRDMFLEAQKLIESTNGPKPAEPIAAKNVVQLNAKNKRR